MNILTVFSNKEGDILYIIEMGKIKFKMGRDESVVKTPFVFYYFLVYVQFIFMPFRNLLTAVTNATGWIYGSDCTIVFDQYPDLKIVSWAYAVVLIGIFVLAMYTRRALVRYDENSPKLLTYYYIVNFVTSIAFDVYLACTSSYYFQKGTLLRVVGYIVLVFISSRFIMKRKELIDYLAKNRKKSLIGE